MAANNQDYINQMYDSNLAAQQAQLESDYNQNQANLEAEQEKARKQADANLVRTYVEAAKAQKNYNEVQNAYGLTSGAMAQARLAQDNQLQADMTTIRAAQQTVDADVERQKNLLAQQYADAIAKAQAENDLARAQALYEEAKEADARLLEQQREAASLMAGVGDYSLLAQLYGLTDEQLARLQGTGSGGNPGMPIQEPLPEPTGVSDESFARMISGLDTMLRGGNYSGANTYIGSRVDSLSDEQVQQLYALVEKYQGGTQ